MIPSKLLNIIPNVILSISALAQAKGIESIYLFKDVLSSDTAALKATSIDSVLIFNVEVHNNTDLVYPRRTPSGDVYTTLVSNGTYAGGDELAEHVKNFKTGSSIDRVEVTLVSGYPTFENIRDFINKDGTGPETLLYRNFAALKSAWDVDAINDDDEGVYDIPSTVAFAKMLGEIGYKFTGAPYTNIPFWKEVSQAINAATPGLFDRMYLQCYDGGAYNDPADWQNELGMKVIPLLWVTNSAKPDQGKTPAEAQAMFEGWERDDQVAGGGYWNDFDIEARNSSYAEYAGVLKNVFG